jgi:hypothetical protein
MSGHTRILIKPTPIATPISFPCTPFPIRSLEPGLQTAEKSPEEWNCAVHLILGPVIARQQPVIARQRANRTGDRLCRLHSPLVCRVYTLPPFSADCIFDRLLVSTQTSATWLIVWTQSTWPSSLSPNWVGKLSDSVPATLWPASNAHSSHWNEDDASRELPTSVLPSRQSAFNSQMFCNNSAFN